MQAFWLTYDSGLTFLDGAEAAQYDSIGPDQIIPFVTADSEVSVVSLQSGSISPAITVRLFGADGELAPPFSRKLSPGSALRARIP